ncbi:MAG: hypothetical protein ABII88_00475 [Candidatus Omnitrophota bacterium]
MIRLKNILCCIICFIFCGAVYLLAGETSQSLEAFRLCDWKIGQFAEYQILSMENEGVENRYRIYIVGEEEHESKKFFWLMLEIFNVDKREVAFKVLTEPYDSESFLKNTASYISQGFLYLLRNSRRVIIVLENNSEYEISPLKFFEQPDILDKTVYERSPCEIGNVDYSNMLIGSEKEEIKLPAGIFDCYRFSIETDREKSYADEGFDLWRSSKVPFLGIVKMEFSKTKFNEKRRNEYSLQVQEGNWLKRLSKIFLKRNVPGGDREDVHTIRLINYQN